MQRSLYGLKQSPRQWNKKLTKFLQDIECRKSRGEPGVYVVKDTKSLLILAVYVDDGLSVFTFKEKLKSIIDSFHERFEITVVKPENFVGLQIEQNKSQKTISINRSIPNKLLTDSD